MARHRQPRNPKTQERKKIKSPVGPVKWERDAPSSTPVHVKDKLTALSITHNQQRDVLAVLRATRSKRQVGTLVIPTHLRDGVTLVDDKNFKPTATPGD